MTEDKTSTAVEKFTDPGPDASSIELAPQAWRLAQRIATTEFVPKGLRGKPEAVMAAMLYGREAGVGEMQALAKIHVVDGRPGMAAELMRALVLQHGHDLWIEESSSTRCTVGGKRRNSERETRVTWTHDDAKRAGLLGKDNWKKYPDAMLLARATAKLCRAIFPDVLAGLSYTLEELSDGDVPTEELAVDLIEQGSEPAAEAPARPRARARKAATRGSNAPEKTEPDPTPKPETPEPELPGEDEDDDIVDAEIVEDDDQADDETPEPELEGDDDEPVDAEIVDEDAFPDDYEGPDTHERGPSYTGPQIIAIRLGELGVTDRDVKLEIVNTLLQLEGDDRISSTNDLERDEVNAFLELLEPYSEGDWIPGMPVEDDDAEPEPAPEKPKRRRRSSKVDPETWDVDRWRSFLRDRKVKVSEVVKEANRLGREQGLEEIPGTIDDLPGSGLCSDLVNFVEDLALERSGS